MRQGPDNTLAGKTREQIRNAIISGELAPGSRLSPPVLAERYGTSTTVVRQALLNLASARMATFEPNQGFFVPSLSQQDLEDLTLVRINTDVLAVRLAVERGDLEWETRLIAAEHRLARTPRSSDGQSSEHLTAVHREFHLELVRGSGIDLLVEHCGVLFDSTELYRRWTAPAAAERDVNTEHRLLTEAAVSRDGELAARLLTEHYRTTATILQDSGLVAETVAEKTAAGRWRSDSSPRALD